LQGVDRVGISPKHPVNLLGSYRPYAFGVPNASDFYRLVIGLSSRYIFVRYGGIIFGPNQTTEEKTVPSPLGDKIRALRKQKKLSLEQLAERTDSSKSYIWELENKDDPKPSAEKINKIAAELEVTTEFLLTESSTTPGEEVLDEAFFRKYKTMSEPDKKKIRKILDAWEDE
jgi:transcriptional regulator with XRE-family HTH domain